MDKIKCNSTLCSFSSDCSALESLKQKSKSAGAMQPKVRGTYQCGRCGMPKIRPHKCGEPAHVASKAHKEESYSPYPETMNLCTPKPSEEPASLDPYSEFSFRSRHVVTAPTDIRMNNNDYTTTQQRFHRNSMSMDDMDKLLDCSASHHPPMSPARSLELPARPQYGGSQPSLLARRGVIQLVSKPAEASEQNSASFYSTAFAAARRPYRTTNENTSTDMTGAFQQYTSSTHTSDAEDNGSCCSSTGSRKRQLAPSGVNSYHEMDSVARPRTEMNTSDVRLAALPIDADVDNVVASTSTQQQCQYQQQQACTRDSMETVTPLYTLPTATTTANAVLKTSASHLSLNSTASSDLSDESETNLSTEEDATELPKESRHVAGLSSFAPFWGMSGANTGSFEPPKGVQMMPFYPSVDTFGRPVMLPCWLPPSVPQLQTATTTTHSTSTPTNTTESNAVLSSSGSSKTKKLRRIASAPSITADTTAAGIDSHIVSPVKKNNRGRRTTKTDGTTTETSLSSANLCDTLETLDTIVTTELDGELDAFALDLDVGCDGDDRPYCDEDEEDLFRYLSEDMAGTTF